MPKGGHAASGPPPDPMALRRDRPDDQASWTLLPAAGREAEPPAWPLLKAGEREAHHWRELWRLPQAVMWERLGQQHEVALFVGALVEVEAGGAPVATQRLARSYMESLGLTVQGMLRNRWRIVGATAPDPATEEKPAAPAKPRRSARSRMTVVKPSA